MLLSGCSSSSTAGSKTQLIPPAILWTAPVAVTLSVAFRPAGTAIDSAASGSISLTVTPATPALT